MGQAPAETEISFTQPLITSFTPTSDHHHLFILWLLSFSACSASTPHQSKTQNCKKVTFLGHPADVDVIVHVWWTVPHYEVFFQWNVYKWVFSFCKENCKCLLMKNQLQSGKNFYCFLNVRIGPLYLSMQSNSQWRYAAVYWWGWHSRFHCSGASGRCRLWSLKHHQLLYQHFGSNCFLTKKNFCIASNIFYIFLIKDQQLSIFSEEIFRCSMIRIWWFSHSGKYQQWVSEGEMWQRKDLTCNQQWPGCDGGKIWCAIKCCLTKWCYLWSAALQRSVVLVWTVSSRE